MRQFSYFVENVTIPEQNARKFYNAFMNGNSKYSVVVVKRTESKTNPNICRTQFLAVCSSFKGNLEVISESLMVFLMPSSKPFLQTFPSNKYISYGIPKKGA